MLDVTSGSADFFLRQEGVLHAEGVPLSRIAQEVGTPAHVYSTAALRAAARTFAAALAPIRDARFAFAVKANPNVAVLRLLADCGFGADIVSGGELERALQAGMRPDGIVFSGVGKTDRELVAALDAGIGQFNLELEEEGEVLSALAVARGVRAPAVLRINPDVVAGTHAKISTGHKDSKFGVAIDDAAAVYARLARLPGLRLRGLALHIGSQLRDFSPLEAAYARIGELAERLRSEGNIVETVDLGGGLGVPYAPDEVVPSPRDYGTMVLRATAGWNAALTFEPGRVIAAAAGLLLTRVVWVKPGDHCPWVIVDAAMNDLARPALYGAYHGFEPVAPTSGRMIAHIAGPVCESGDVFATARGIAAVVRGDLAVFHTTGAYGAAMASTYNCRTLAHQVLVDGDAFEVVG